MRDINFYIKEAKTRSKSTSNRKLCAMMGIAHNSIGNWEKRNILPSDETMIKLAQVAGISPYVALIDLNAWRSNGAVKKTYEGILEKIKAIILVGAFGASIAASSSPANAANIIETYKHNHIMEYTLSHLLKVLRKLAYSFLHVKCAFTAPFRFLNQPMVA